jgi:ankyrin repeat protein
MSAPAVTSQPTVSSPPPITSDPVSSTQDANLPIPTLVESSTTPTPSLYSSLTWKTLRSRVSVSEKTSAQLGWAVAVLSVVITIATLAPTFRAQASSDKALRLAEWTALKDYIEECREELAAGIQSQACIKAMNAKLPPPPYVDHGLLDTVRRSLGMENRLYNGTWRHAAGEHSGTQAFLHFWMAALLIVACVFFVFAYFEHRRTRLLRLSYASSKKGDDDVHESSPLPPTTEPTISSTIRHPPPAVEATLRRRPVRTHPIYRHANLEEAIHHSDLAEIRTRLSHGEDVNKHWPYLIYSLAISPANSITESRLEVARLCLDFGADVNALKGWNGQSALLIAIHFGNVAISKLLIANGALVSYSPPDSNLTALHRCVRLAVTGSATDALDIMELLFQFGANPNQADRLGETPLHHLMIDASLSRHSGDVLRKLYPVAQCLVEHGARMPATIKSRYVSGNPLWDIVKNEHWDVEWAENVGSRYDMVQVGSAWIKQDDLDGRYSLRHWKRSGEVQELAGWKYAFLDREMTRVIKWPAGAGT